MGEGHKLDKSGRAFNIVINSQAIEPKHISRWQLVSSKSHHPVDMCHSILSKMSEIACYVTVL